MTIHTGDCIEVMRGMEPDSVDAVVTDPPYNLEFMGKAWDKNLNHGPWATEAFRVLKPGGYLLAFGGTRTVHRLASAIEDAGFEIRDELVWIYASGFPKSLDVSKALDKIAGAEREVVGERDRYLDGKKRQNLGNRNTWGDSTTFGTNGVDAVTAPATDLARQWQGWGTALKPAHEPIVMARKPLVGTVAQNVTRYGTGALNIDGSRIGTEGGGGNGLGSHMDRLGDTEPGLSFGEDRTGTLGRWPSNVLLSDPELFDKPNPGVVGSGATTTDGVAVRHNSGGNTFGGDRAKPPMPDMSYRRPAGTPDRSDIVVGGYSRFFIIPKADRAEREPVLRGQLGKQAYGQSGGAQAAIARGEEYQGADASTGLNRVKQRENAHPTVKPVDLMRHLVRLVTPLGGTVLDPFLGSGTTAIACELEGFPWIGIETEPEYVAIAEARLNGTQRGLGLDVPTSGRKRKPSTGHWPKDRTPGANGWGFTGQTGLEERWDKEPE